MRCGDKRVLGLSCSGWASQAVQWKRIRVAMQEMQETRLRSLGQEDPLEKEMATHSSIFAWKIHGQRSLAGPSPWVPKSRTELSD